MQEQLLVVTIYGTAWLADFGNDATLLSKA
jgi:hypothetical protein